MSGLAAAPLSESELLQLDRELQKVADQHLRAQIVDPIRPLMTADALANWPVTAPDRQAWTAMAATGAAAASTAPAVAVNVASAAGASVPASVSTSETYVQRLTDYLAKLACKPRWEAGSVATGVAKRALEAEFKGDPARIYDRLSGDGCPGGKAIAPQVRTNLINALDRARND
jgi:hypothetical protein